MLDKTLLQQTIKYLNQVLGENAVHVVQSEVVNQLPYFLHDTYEVLPGKMLGQPITLACMKGHEPIAAQQMDQHTRRLQELLNAPVIVAMNEIAPGERRQLIEQGVAFVVPNRQLFAPQMGMILTERFGNSTKRKQELASPATQALLIWYLNHHPTTDTWHPFQAAAALGYAGMTATRAIRELMQFKLFELDVRGRTKYLKLQVDRRQLWELAKPYLRTPVLNTLFTYDRRVLNVPSVRWAGESALARISMVNEPQQQVVALTAEAVQKAKKEGIFFEPRKLADGIAVQVWRYLPTMQIKENTVDPLSLWLSLSGNPDDRIQLALNDIEEKFKW